jgi:hypothetical protein
LGEERDDKMSDLEREIQDRVRALAFDNRGLNNEVTRLRKALDRIYWSIPAGNAPTDVEATILAVYREMDLEPSVDEKRTG